MTILLFEDNLMWSVRLRKQLEFSGHTVVVLKSLPAELPSADAAIVNLGSAAFQSGGLIGRLRSTGIRTVGHAGHKEKDLHEAGLSEGVDLNVTNRELSERAAEVITRLMTA